MARFHSNWKTNVCGVLILAGLVYYIYTTKGAISEGIVLAFLASATGCFLGADARPKP